MYGHSYAKIDVVAQIAATLGTAVGDRLAAVIDRVAAWQERARSRRLLATLDDRMLNDIGVDRATAEHESETAFWR